MKKTFTKFLSFCFLLCLISGTVSAQGDIDQLLQGSVGDMEKLATAYVEPFAVGFGKGLNSGWYNTAKPHKIAGIDITATVNLVRVPADKETYNIPSLGLTSLELKPGQDPDAATLFGPAGNGPLIQTKAKYPNGHPQQGQAIAEFNAPPGIGLKEEFGINSFPVPMAQVGIGLPKGTEVKVRYLPAIDLGDGEIKMFGIGVMHDVKQWIPVIKQLPFDLSGFVGYTSMETNVAFNTSGTQRAVFDAKALTIQGLISKKVSVLTVYGGLGINQATTKMQVLGDFTYTEGSTGSSATVSDPINIEFKEFGPRATAGVRLKLLILTLHGEYTLQKYSTMTVGVGLSVR